MLHGFLSFAIKISFGQLISPTRKIDSMNVRANTILVYYCYDVMRLNDAIVDGLCDAIIINYCGLSVGCGQNILV